MTRDTGLCEWPNLPIREKRWQVHVGILFSNFVGITPFHNAHGANKYDKLCEMV
jgi:hypothetical protein